MMVTLEIRCYRIRCYLDQAQGAVCVLRKKNRRRTAKKKNQSIACFNIAVMLIVSQIEMQIEN